MKAPSESRSKEAANWRWPTAIVLSLSSSWHDGFNWFLSLLRVEPWYQRQMIMTLGLPVFLDRGVGGDFACRGHPAVAEQKPLTAGTGLAMVRFRELEFEYSAAFTGSSAAEQGGGVALS